MVNYFISDLYDAESTLSKFPTILIWRGRGNHEKGKQSICETTVNAILRVLNKPDKWADRNLMKFNQSKCTTLHLRHNHPTQQTGWSQLDGKQLYRKGPGNAVAQQIEQDSRVCPCDKGGQLYTALY